MVLGTSKPIHFLKRTIMNLARYLCIAVMLAATVVALHSCASSTMLVEEWHDTAYNAPALNNVLVISFSKDPARRRMWEDAFVTVLAGYNVAATPLYRQYPENMPDSAQVGATVRNGNYQGFVVIRRIPQVKEVHYVPEYVSTEAATRYNPFIKQYETFYKDIVHPGFVDTLKFERRVVDFWVTGDKPHVIWSGTTSTPVPAQPDQLRTEVTTTILSELARYGYIPAKKKDEKK
jgi:hypothetical protein